MNTATKILITAYSGDQYVRPQRRDLAALGGILVASSNDGQSAVSFSPTDEWEFPDGSRLEVGASLCEVL